MSLNGFETPVNNCISSEIVFRHSFIWQFTTEEMEKGFGKRKYCTLPSRPLSFLNMHPPKKAPMATLSQKGIAHWSLCLFYKWYNSIDKRVKQLKLETVPQSLEKRFPVTFYSTSVQCMGCNSWQNSRGYFWFISFILSFSLSFGPLVWYFWIHILFRLQFKWVSTVTNWNFWLTAAYKGTYSHSYGQHL